MGKRRFLQSYIRLLLLAGMLTATMACSDSETYTRYPCHLVIDNSIHQNSTLGAAMNAMSPGVFCIISSDELKKQYAFTNNLGQESRVNFTAVDLDLPEDVVCENVHVSDSLHALAYYMKDR